MHTLKICRYKVGLSNWKPISPLFLLPATNFMITCNKNSPKLNKSEALKSLVSTRRSATVKVQFVRITEKIQRFDPRRGRQIFCRDIWSNFAPYSQLSYNEHTGRILSLERSDGEAKENGVTNTSHTWLPLGGVAWRDSRGLLFFFYFCFFFICTWKK